MCLKHAQDDRRPSEDSESHLEKLNRSLNQKLRPFEDFQDYASPKRRIKSAVPYGAFLKPPEWLKLFNICLG